MSTVRFATICDHCGKRSPEYDRYDTCADCGDDVCPSCSVSVSYQNNPDSDVVVCPTCQSEYEAEQSVLAKKRGIK
jgi:hypothetical protein